MCIFFHETTTVDEMINDDFSDMLFACCGVKVMILIDSDGSDGLSQRQIHEEFACRLIANVLFKYI